MASTAFSSGLWFIAIIAAIPVALWLLRRSPAGARYSGSAGGGAAALRQIADLRLSPTQRVVTVEVGQGEARRWLVLGVTAQQINALHTLLPPEGPIEAPAPGSARGLPPVFAQVLARLQPKGRGGS